MKAKVYEELANITSATEGRESNSISKTVKDAVATILPSIANIISVAVSTVVSTALKKMEESTTSKLAGVQRQCLLNKYGTVKLEQYFPRENLPIVRYDEEANETEDVLEANIIKLAGDIGMELKPDGLSVAHRMGKPKERGRPVIVRFCHRKKKYEVIRWKQKLKGKQRKVYVNDDLTSLKAKMMNLVKEQDVVKNVSTRDGSILAWLLSGGKPVIINTPDNLH